MLGLIKVGMVGGRGGGRIWELGCGFVVVGLNDVFLEMFCFY